jgi:HAD superfamily hydrolase (TIGR01662 family)
MIAAVEVVLFDLGNTLFYDNAAAWPRVYARAEAALWRVLRRSGVRTSSEVVYGKPETLLSHYYALRGSGVLEPGTFHVLRDLLVPHAPEVSDATVTRALRAMYGVTQRNWKIERDASRTLRELKRRGFRVGAISNGSDDWNAKELLRRARLDKWFDLVLTSAAQGRRKPDPTIFLAALQHFQVEAGRAVMIGDSYDADILGAGALGIRTVWITRRVGALAMPTPNRADATLPALGEVPTTLG